MGLSIDWEFLAKVAAGVGDTTAGMLVQEYQRKRKEQEDVRNMERSHKYSMAEFHEKQARQVADTMSMEKELIKVRSKQAQLDSDRKTQVDVFFGSPEFTAHIQNGLTSPDPMTKAATMAQANTINKLKANIPLTGEDDKALAAIQDPAVAAGIAGLRQQNAQTNMQMKYMEAQAGYLQALKIQAGLKGDTRGFTDNDILAIEKTMVDNDVRINTLMQDKEFMAISSKADKIQRGLQGQPPQAIQQALMKELGETNFGIYQNSIMTMQKIQQLNAELRQRVQMMKGAVGISDMPRQRQEQPQPEPQQEPETQEDGGVDIKNILGQVFKVATGKAGFQKDQAVRVVKRKYGLPEDARVYTFDSPEEEDAFRKSPGAVGAYVFVSRGNEKGLWKLVKHNKVVGFQKVIEK